MVVIFGFSELFWALPRLERRNVGSPDLMRSGWTDLRAFTIADLSERPSRFFSSGPYLEPSSEAWRLAAVSEAL